MVGIIMVVEPIKNREKLLDNVVISEVTNQKSENLISYENSPAGLAGKNINKKKRAGRIRLT